MVNVSNSMWFPASVSQLQYHWSASDTCIPSGSQVMKTTTSETQNLQLDPENAPTIKNKILLISWGHLKDSHAPFYIPLHSPSRPNMLLMCAYSSAGRRNSALSLKFKHKGRAQI